MRPLTWLAVAAGLTLLVSLSLPLGICAVLALRDRPPESPLGAASGVVAEGQADEPAPQEAAQSPCRISLQPGEDITAAVAAQPIGAVVCLARGVHRPF